ncbi:MAG: hypothetical protein Ct9H300mP25_14690 [Acidobacteriota bacterium]|nr:MAG: hypothetical protein Ct9H300mP25_14690 [Acidobacteriota bacterium]
MMAGKPVRLLALVAIYVIVAHVLPAPEGSMLRAGALPGFSLRRLPG